MLITKQAHQFTSHALTLHVWVYCLQSTQDAQLPLQGSLRLKEQQIYKRQAGEIQRTNHFFSAFIFLCLFPYFLFYLLFRSTNGLQHVSFLNAAPIAILVIWFPSKITNQRQLIYSEQEFFPYKKLLLDCVSAKKFLYTHFYSWYISMSFHFRSIRKVGNWEKSILKALMLQYAEYQKYGIWSIPILKTKDLIIHFVTIASVWPTRNFSYTLLPVCYFFIHNIKSYTKTRSYIIKPLWY